MRLYEVVVRENNYNDKSQIVRVTASSAVRAAEFCSKKAYTSYSGRVTSVTEVYPNVVTAK